MGLAKDIKPCMRSPSVSCIMVNTWGTAIRHSSSSIHTYTLPPPPPLASCRNLSFQSWNVVGDMCCVCDTIRQQNAGIDKFHYDYCLVVTSCACHPSNLLFQKVYGFDWFHQRESSTKRHVGLRHFVSPMYHPVRTAVQALTRLP